MKKIKPISLWANGQAVEATKLNAYAVNVTLEISATFYYALLSDDNQTLAQGNLTLTGEEYQSWNEDKNAWDFIAEQLNLEIIGDDEIVEN